MRPKSEIIASLEAVYRDAFDKAVASEDAAKMEALDFGFQRDQVLLEVMMDIRDGLARTGSARAKEEPSLLDQAKKIRAFTKLKKP